MISKRVFMIYFCMMHGTHGIRPFGVVAFCSQCYIFLTVAQTLLFDSNSSSSYGFMSLSYHFSASSLHLSQLSLLSRFLFVFLLLVFITFFFSFVFCFPSRVFVLFQSLPCSPVKFTIKSSPSHFSLRIHIYIYLMSSGLGAYTEIALLHRLQYNTMPAFSFPTVLGFRPLFYRVTNA